MHVQVFEVAGDVLQPQLAHNLCRLVAEQDSELHSTAVQVCQQGMLQSIVQAGCPCQSGAHQYQRVYTAKLVQLLGDSSAGVAKAMFAWCWCWLSLFHWACGVVM